MLLSGRQANVVASSLLAEDAFSILAKHQHVPHLHTNRIWIAISENL